MLHDGHRRRMYEKLNNGDDLFDHELLEILLFGACPRINTNPMAHALLERFVSISGVFNASVEELKAVDGVGDNVARFIKTVGLCAERAGNIGNTPVLKTADDCKRFIDARLRGKSEEQVEIYFLNRAGRVRRILSYNTGEKSRAAVSVDAIARDFALYIPHGVIIAHNHVHGGTAPSDYDDHFTRTVQFICNMYGAQLLDHVIYVSLGETFSYKNEGRLEEIKSSCSWDKFEKWIKTLN